MSKSPVYKAITCVFLQQNHRELCFAGTQTQTAMFGRLLIRFQNRLESCFHNDRLLYESINILFLIHSAIHDGGS